MSDIRGSHLQAPSGGVSSGSQRFVLIGRHNLSPNSPKTGAGGEMGGDPYISQRSVWMGKWGATAATLFLKINKKKKKNWMVYHKHLVLPNSYAKTILSRLKACLLHSLSRSVLGRPFHLWLVFGLSDCIKRHFGLPQKALSVLYT